MLLAKRVDPVANVVEIVIDDIEAPDSEVFGVFFDVL